MENKKVKITMDESKNINIFVNDEFKYTIDNNVNSISAREIYDVLDVKSVERIDIENIDDAQVNEKKYKMIYELFSDIIKEINDFSENIVYDVGINVENKQIKEFNDIK